VLRQHGLLHVALDDLQEALDTQRRLGDIPQIQECRDRLRVAHDEVVARKTKGV